MPISPVLHGPKRQTAIAVLHRLPANPQLWRELGCVLLMVLAVLFFTATATHGDTPNYAGELLSYEEGGSFTESKFLDPGHLLLRPTTLLLHRSLAGVLPSPNPAAQIMKVLDLESSVCGLLASLCAYLLARSWSGSALLAGLCTLSLLTANAFLVYTHSGHAYVPGEFLLLLSYFLLTQFLRRPRSTGLLIAAGLVLGAAVLLWLPFVLAAPPAAVLLLVCDPAPLAVRLKRCVLLAAVTSLLVFAAYGLAAALVGVRSVAQLSAWLKESGHGWGQNRNLVRSVMGFARSFFYIENGILLKRYLFKDPYANVTFAEILGATAGKVAAFYLLLGSMCLVLVRAVELRKVLLVWVTALAATLFFAIVVFEGGSPERYMPLYPAFLIGLAACLAQWRRFRLPAVICFGVPLLWSATNVYAMFRPSVEREQAATVERARLIREKIGTSGQAFLINYQDSLFDFVDELAHPLNQPHPIGIIDIIEVSSVTASEWRSEFRTHALALWNSGQSVWVTKRVFAERPLREWMWVEGDNPNVHWSDMPAFFRQFSISAEIGGADGYNLIPDTPANRQVLDLAAGRKGTAK